ncbi:hypothetical protein K7G98_36795, partial [Saccharothrix sp. MB29]|nr:hypothetical protein [Saccharothrix sp. MB29]
MIKPGRGWKGHVAGLYVRVGVDVDCVRLWRAYSVTSPADRADGRITITVKAMPDGISTPACSPTSSSGVAPSASTVRSVVVNVTAPPSPVASTVGRNRSVCRRSATPCRAQCSS